METSIFNDDDEKRFQCPIESLFTKRNGLAKVCGRLDKWLAVEFPQHQPTDHVVLFSMAKCGSQPAHTDYTQQSLEQVLVDEEGGGDTERIPLACVMAMEDSTPFDVWPGALRYDHVDPPVQCTRLRLNRGDVLVFRADLVHGGAAFELANVRIHAYLDVEGVNRVKDWTFMMNNKSHIAPRGAELEINR